jgi:diadenosine tetraphosphate (Ap4A) HIT family hydrolase
MKTDDTFVLHSRLAGDTFEIGRLQLCRVLLMNDARYPWLILVPERAGLVELVDLDVDEHHRMADEIRHTSLAMRELFKPDKLNVAALGNMVPQLHVHVIARYIHDDAWPRPVWGGMPAPPYEPVQAVKRVNDVRAALRIA